MQDVIGILSGIVVIIGLILAIIGNNIERKEAREKYASQAIFDSKAEFRAAMAKDEADDYLVKEVVPGIFEQPHFETTVEPYIVTTHAVLTPNEKREMKENISQGVAYIRLDPPHTGWIRH